MADSETLSRDQIAALLRKARTAILTKANNTPVSIRQKTSLKDGKADATSLVTNLKLPAPPTEQRDIQQLLFRAIQILGQGGEQWELPSPQTLRARWTYTPPSPSPGKGSLDWSDEMKYHNMTNNTTSAVTIFYVHGGAFILNTPARFHGIISSLSKRNGGRCFSINYRLAPQHPFPAALLDVLVAYLSLLHPPPNSHHAPVPASSIVLAGDSSGACLVLALVQVFLAARKAQATDLPTVSFHGREVTLQMPSGLALQIPWTDQTGCLPSWRSNGTFDLVQEVSSVMLPNYPPDSIWPSNPPRGNIYCETSMICHPLVSPSAALSWVGAPPMWFALGEERMVDAAKVIIKRAYAQGVNVHWEQYEAMPHNWPMLFPNFSQSKLCMRRWAGVCRMYVETQALPSSAEFVSVSQEIRKVDLDELSAFTPEETLARMRNKQARMKPWCPATGTEKL